VQHFRLAPILLLADPFMQGAEGKAKPSSINREGFEPWHRGGHAGTYLLVPSSVSHATAEAPGLCARARLRYLTKMINEGTLVLKAMCLVYTEDLH
jgi:hypothetical protein